MSKITFDFAKLCLGTLDMCNNKVSYLELTEEFTKSKNKFNNAKVYALSDRDCINVPNLYTHLITDEEYPFYTRVNFLDMNVLLKVNFTFCYHLKSFAIDYCLQNSSSDYIIYLDGDILLDEEKFSEDSIQEYLLFMKNNDLDFFSTLNNTRSEYIPSRWNNKNKHIQTLFGTDIGNVDSFFEKGNFLDCTECVMFLKNTEKTKRMINHWKEIYKNAIKNNIIQYSESFEIGILLQLYEMKYIENYVRRTEFFYQIKNHETKERTYL
jgi:hypothetical protein